SPRHNPEFTMMEFYAAYVDYRWLMDFTEDLLRRIAAEVNGSLTFEYQGRQVDVAGPFDRLTIVEAIRKHAPEFTLQQLHDAEFIRNELRRRGVDVAAPPLTNAGLGALQLALFEETAESQLWQPTFIVDYPV